MPSLLLICCLLLNGSESCSKRVNNHPMPVSVQTTSADLPALLDQVRLSDEPSVRVFLRLRITAHLWKYPDDTLNPKAVLREAETDLQAHEKEIPPQYVELFRRELLAQRKAHMPEAAALQSARASVQDGAAEQRSDLEVAYALLRQENGIDKAVDLARRSLASATDPGHTIVLFLDKLEQVKPDAVPSVLDALMSAEEVRPGSISPGTLFTLKYIFIRDKTPLALRQRYLAAIIRNAGDTNASTASLIDTYAILTDVLPVVEKELPDAYPAASILLEQMSGRVPSGTRERIEVEKRLRQSSDPLEQLLIEINAARDPSLKKDLQTQAAGLALERGQLRKAIDLAAALELRATEAGQWRDQFLVGVVGRALDKKDIETAQYGLERIWAVNIRISALQKIALYLHASGDIAGARDTLNTAYKLLKVSDDSAAKVGMLLDLAGVYAKVDSQRTSEVMRATIKIINVIPTATRKPSVPADVQLSNAETVMQIAYRLVPAFQALGAADQSEAEQAAGTIERQSLKAAAKFGAYTALPTLVRMKQAAASQ